MRRVSMRCRYTSEAALTLLGDAMEEAASLQLPQWHALCYEASRFSEDADEVTHHMHPSSLITVLHPMWG